MRILSINVNGFYGSSTKSKNVSSIQNENVKKLFPIIEENKADLILLQEYPINNKSLKIDIESHGYSLFVPRTKCNPTLNGL